MDLKKLNEALLNVGNKYVMQKKFTVIATSRDNNFGEELEEGETSSEEVVYNADLGDGLYLKVVYECDSYGSNSGLSSIQIVKPVEQLVTNFITVE